MLKGIVGVGLWLCALCVNVAQAGVLYAFSGTYEVAPGGVFNTAQLSLTTSSPVTADATFDPGPDLTCDACTDIEFVVDAVAAGFTHTPSQIIVYAYSGGSSFFYFAPGSFTTDGTYPTILLAGANDGTLTVQTTAVPAPATSILLVAGLLGLLGSKPRRLAVFR